MFANGCKRLDADIEHRYFLRLCPESFFFAVAYKRSIIIKDCAGCDAHHLWRDVGNVKNFGF